MATPAAILFDLDGTLIDTMDAFADVAAEVIVHHHGHDRASARQAYLATSGIPFFRQLEVIFPGHLHNRAAAAEFEERKLLVSDDVQPSDATRAALEDLRQRGISLAVCSNNFQPQVDAFIARCPATFELALGFGNGLAKGPTQFDRVCEALGCTRNDLVFVGDSIIDAELALATGVRFIGKLGTFEAGAFAHVAPDAPVVDELAELLDLFA